MKKILTVFLSALLILYTGSTYISYAFSIRTSAPTSNESAWKYYSSPLNTFPLSPYNNGNCTWYAYGRAYEVYGKDPGLRKAGNAGAWYNYAKNNGFSVGSVPKAGSIICWSTDGNNGHVAFVEKVSGDSITFTESNYQYSSSSAVDPWRTCTTPHPETYCSGYGGKLQGYIYLNENEKSSSGTNVSFSLDSSSNIINNTDARVYTWLYKSPGQNLTNAGIYIWPSNGSAPSAPTYSESFAAYDNYSSRENVHINYQIGSGKEVNYKLSEGTSYSYKVYCVVDGKEFVTSVGSFKTTGEHTHSFNEKEQSETEQNNFAKEFKLTIGKKEAEVWGKTKFNDVAPKIKNGRTMLPARFVAENLGAEVEWNQDEKKVTISTDKTDIIIFVNSDKAYVNGKKYILDSVAFIENGRTYTPVRFIAENLGAKVEWDSDKQQVIISK